MARELDLSTLPTMDFGSRLQRARDRIEATGCGALLVTNPENRRYLTGFTGSAAMLLVRRADALLVTDNRYRDQAREQMDQAGVDVELVVSHSKGQLEALDARTKGVERIGLEADSCSWSMQMRLAEAFDGELVATHGVIEALRVSKDPGELARIEKACELADVALAMVKTRLADGISEAQFAAELEFEMLTRGAESPAFETIVASGSNSALPHARPTRRLIGEGELIVVDFGATFDGYRSDMTRTFCVGSVPSHLVDLIDAVFASQRAGLRAVAEHGATGASVDRACRESLENAGYGEVFLHGTGHGIGLEVHEAPGLGAGSADSLPVGTVVTVEPGAYLVGQGGVRIEDTVVVTESGARALTKSTKDYAI